MKIKLIILYIFLFVGASGQDNLFDSKDYSHRLFAGSKFFMENDYFRAFSGGYGFSKDFITLSAELEFYDKQANNAWFGGIALTAVPLKFGRIGVCFQTGYQFPLSYQTTDFNFTNINFLIGIKRYSLISNNPAAIGASIGYDFRFFENETKNFLYPKLYTIFFF
jgi:hypothetical protein